MFVGVYERQLDERGRVALPSAFRGELGSHCYVSIGDDRCVSVFSEDEFGRQAHELVELVKRGEATRDRQRAWASSAVKSAIDKQGRITLDNRLREHAGIEPQAPVQVLGSLDHLEIWEPTRFAASEEAGQEEISGGGA